MTTRTDADGQPVNRAFNSERRLERDISEMLGLAKGILADGNVDEDEVLLIRQWLVAHPDAVDSWPGNVLSERLEHIFADGHVSKDERLDLQELLADLVGGKVGIIGSANAATKLPLDKPAPEISFRNRVFVLTGKFAFGPRKVCQQFTVSAGGICEDGVTRRTHYLIIGTFGSLDWIQTSHGRKIEKALRLRADSQKIHIIGEDHWAASLPKDN